jgi:antitoxin ParD1/3/4
MSIELSPENSRYISDLVSRGAFANEAQALDEAVLLLKRRESLRADVQLGIDQADRGELIPADEVFSRLEERADQIENAAGGS